MGMYLSAYRKVGEKKFEHDYRWPDDKWTDRYKFYRLIDEDAEYESNAPENAHPMDYYPPLIRPKDIADTRRKLQASDFNHEPFNKLLDLMEKDKSVYVIYD